MKKRSFCVLAAALALLLLAGCGVSAAAETPGAAAPTPGFLPELPENLSLAIDLSAVPQPGEVRRLPGEAGAVRVEEVQAALSRLWPEGDYRVSGQGPVLMIRDQSVPTNGRLVNLARVTPGEGTQTTAFGGAMNNGDLRPWADLEGLPGLETALGELEELLTAAAPGRFTALEAYALDAAALEAHERILADDLNANLAEGAEPYTVYPWEAGDACYLVIYAYAPDGLPLYYRRNLNLQGGRSPISYTFVFYGRGGLVRLEAYGLYGAGEAEEALQPMEPEEMLRRFLANLEQEELAEGTALTAMELCCLPIVARDGTELIPVWTFETAWPNPEAGTRGQDPMCSGFYLYDAVSGEAISAR